MAIVRGCDFPDDLAYDDDLNLWFRDAGVGSWDVGITSFGLARSGEIYMFNPRPPGRAIELGRAFALIEVAKTVLAVRCPFNCTITAVNEALTERPAPLNRDPYDHWLCRLAVTPPQTAAQALQALVRGAAVIGRATDLMELHAFDGPPDEAPGAVP